MSVTERISAYAFGPFVLHLRDRVLYRTGLPIEMHAKVFEILRCFAGSEGRLVSKQQLADEVWDGSPIGDNNIAQHVHMVREVLGDVTKPHRYIATVHGRGYRLLVQPHAVTSSSEAAHSVPQPAAAAESLAAELLSNAAFFTSMGTPAALESSSQLCRKALEIEPGFAQAHAAIAWNAVLTAVFLFGEPRQQFDVARRNACAALELEPRCARAHLAMAVLAVLDDHAPAAAHPHLDTAATALPDLPGLGIVRIAAFSAQGQHGAARLAAQEAANVHASSSAVTAYKAFAAYHAGDLEFARRALERLLVFRPGAAFATYMLGMTHLARHNYAGARPLFHSLLAGRISLLPAYEKFRLRATAALAFVEARTGSPDDARALVRDIARSPHCSYVALALARVGLGEEDSVVACLERGCERRDPWFPFVWSDPLFADYGIRPQAVHS